MGGEEPERAHTRNDPAQTDMFSRAAASTSSPTTRPPKRSASARARSRGDAARSRGSRGGDSGRAARYSAARRSTPDSGLAASARAPRSARPVSRATRGASLYARRRPSRRAGWVRKANGNSGRSGSGRASRPP